MNTPTDDTDKEGAACGIGRALGNCALQHAGCERLLDVLVYLYPPWEVIAEMRQRNDLTPAARAWLKRLATITSE